MTIGTVIVIGKVAAAVIFGLLAGFGAVYIFNKMPAEWLCDYDEKPDPILADPSVQRVKGYPWRWVYAAGFICLLIRLLFVDMQLGAAGLFACWALLMIGLADLKYMIIPDQFVIMLALTGLGFIPFHDSYLDLILGAAVGGGIMLLVAVIGSISYKKEVMGFGDVKLYASLGLVLGLKGIIVVLVGSSITAGIMSAAALLTGKASKEDVRPLGPHICGWGIFVIFILWPFYL